MPTGHLQSTMVQVVLPVLENSRKTTAKEKPTAPLRKLFADSKTACLRSQLLSLYTGFYHWDALINTHHHHHRRRISARNPDLDRWRPPLYGAHPEGGRGSSSDDDQQNKAPIFIVLIIGLTCLQNTFQGMAILDGVAINPSSRVVRCHRGRNRLDLAGQIWNVLGESLSCCFLHFSWWWHANTHSHTWWQS